MNLRTSLAILFVIIPSMCWGDPVLVKFGNQNGFSRVVLTLPQNDAVWDVTSNDGVITVDIENANGYDLTNFEARPDKTVVRDARVLASGSQLEIIMACSCEISSFVINNRYLTIDISTSRPQLQPSTTFDEVGRFPLVNLAQPWHLQRESQIDAGRSVRPNPLPYYSSTDVSAILSTGLATATYQGLLSGPESKPDIAAQIPQKDLPRGALEAIGIGVETRSSVVAAPQRKTDYASTCEAIATSLENGAHNDISFSLAIGDVRQALAEEPEELSSEAIIRLAILYIVNGMGTEAQSLLSFQQPTDHVQSLTFIAGVLDDASVSPPFDLSLCESEVAFWQFLDTSIEAEQEYRPQELMLIFKTLPKMVQQKVLPHFKLALASHGLPQFSDELGSFSEVQRTALQLDENIQELQKRRAASTKQHTLVRTSLTESNFDPKLQIVLDPIDLQSNALSSVRVEYRDTAPEVPLLKSEIENLVNRGSILDAIQLLASSRERIGDNLYFDLLDTLIRPAVSALGDAEVASLAYQQDLPELTPQILNDLSTRSESLRLRAPLIRSNPQEAGSESDPIPFIEKEERAINNNLESQFPVDDPLTFDASEKILDQSISLRNEINALLGIDN